MNSYEKMYLNIAKVHLNIAVLFVVSKLKAVALDQSQEAVCLTKENADR